MPVRVVAVRQGHCSIPDAGEGSLESRLWRVETALEGQKWRGMKRLREKILDPSHSDQQFGHQVWLGDAIDYLGGVGSVSSSY
jgi:hypothetical protein